VRFEWDPEKAAENARIHGVTFEEAKGVFATQEPVLEIYDAVHSDVEDRFKTIGPVERGVVLVVWTERSDEVVRIISAWWATKAERDMYETYLEEHDV
jgi:uncharacterized DUF497 family protein